MKCKNHYNQDQLIPTAQREAEIQSQIVHYLTDRGFLVIRINSFSTSIGGRFIKSYYIYNNKKSRDFPDLLILGHGKSYLIESKATNGELSDGQIEFKSLADRHGVIVIVAKCVDDVRRVIERNDHL